MYNKIVATHQELREIENSPYFTQRLNEAQLAEERAEAEAKGVAKGRAEGIAEGVKKGEDHIVSLLKSGCTLEEIENILRNERASLKG